MGEVYRASDLRLERSVAIKVLPAHHPVTPSVRASNTKPNQFRRCNIPISASSMTSALKTVSTSW